MYQIFELQAESNQMKIAEEANTHLHNHFETLYDTRDDTYANGRNVRNFFEVCLANQANRIAKLDDITDEDLTTIKGEDLPL